MDALLSSAPLSVPNLPLCKIKYLNLELFEKLWETKLKIAIVIALEKFKGF